MAFFSASHNENYDDSVIQLGRSAAFFCAWCVHAGEGGREKFGDGTALTFDLSKLIADLVCPESSGKVSIPISDGSPKMSCCEGCMDTVRTKIQYQTSHLNALDNPI